MENCVSHFSSQAVTQNPAKYPDHGAWFSHHCPQLEIKALLDKAKFFNEEKKEREERKKRKEGRRLIANHVWPCDGTISFALETLSVSSFFTSPIAHADADARELSITAPGSNYQLFRPTEHLRDV